MAEGESKSRPLLALAGALGVAILVIAFLLGRESARNAPDDVHVVGNQLLPVAPAEPEMAHETKTARDPWQERDEEYAYADAHFRSIEGVDQRPDGTIVLSNIRDDPEAKSDSVEATSAVEPDATRGDARNAVAEYFRQVDLIRSPAGAGDPNTFAMDLIKAGMGGATSGFDRLISDIDRMTQELEHVTPPPSCMVYHQANLASLEESRAMLEGLKHAITARDISALGMIAQQAANLQARAEALKVLEEQIRASTR
jgi:hypothetical protein